MSPAQLKALQPSGPVPSLEAAVALRRSSDWPEPSEAWEVPVSAHLACLSIETQVNESGERDYVEHYV